MSIRGAYRELVVLLCVVGSFSAEANNGDQMLGANAIQWGMAGATVGAPQDAAALFYNPAGLADLEIEEVRFDMGFGVINPPREVNGQNSDSDYYFVPAGAAAFKYSEQLRFGVGMAGLAGQGVDVPDAFPGTPGFQAVVTTKQFFRLAPTASYAVTEKLSVGASFNINYQSLALSNSNFDLGQTPVWGYGFTFGLFYRLSERWRFGLSYLTEQDMETVDWNSQQGRFSLDLDQPSRLAFGVGFRPAAGWLIAADITHIAFSDVQDEVDFDTPAGPSVLNFGWDDQTVFAIAVQKEITPRLTLRTGFNYGKSPIDEEDVDTNLGSPAITEEHWSVGLTRQMGKRVYSSFSYVRGFSNEVTSDTAPFNRIKLEQNVFHGQLTYEF